jgi:hypothetical protein
VSLLHIGLGLINEHSQSETDNDLILRDMGLPSPPVPWPSILLPWKWGNWVRRVAGTPLPQDYTYAWAQRDARHAHLN